MKRNKDNPFPKWHPFHDMTREERMAVIRKQLEEIFDIKLKANNYG